MKDQGREEKCKGIIFLTHGFEEETYDKNGRRFCVICDLLVTNATFLEGIQPPAGTELQRLRAELLEERATSARLQQEVDGLRALK